MTMLGYEFGKNLQDPVVVKVENERKMDTMNVASTQVDSHDILMWLIVIIMLMIVLIIFFYTIASMFRAKKNARAAVQI